MCIAIMKPKGEEITKETLRNCFNANPDGAGFMYSEKNKLTIEKGFFSFDDFWNAYEPHQEKNAAIHFRIKTHGKIDEVNCHPFKVDRTLGFIHNGTIANHGTAAHSDTYMFNEEVIKPMLKRFGKNALYNPVIKRLIEDYIGWSKLVFLNNHGDYEIFNEEKGHWFNGSWFSNSSYRPPEPKKETVKTYGTPYEPKVPPRYYGNTQTYYLPKADGTRIFKGDDIKFETSWCHIRKGQTGVVNHVYSSGHLDINLDNGSDVTYVPGGVVEKYDWETTIVSELDNWL